MIENSKKPGIASKIELLPAVFFALPALILVLYVRVRLIGMPFERDEGEYAYSGQLILKGLSPYLHAYTMKLPGMAYLNALFLFVFGNGIMSIRLGLLMANILTSILLFFTGRRILGTSAGLFAAAVYGLTTLSQHMLGIFAHATHYIVLFVFAAYLCIIIGDDRTAPSPFRCLCGGILFGCAFMIKQHAVFFLVAGILSLLFYLRPLKSAAKSITIILCGFSIPYFAVLLLVIRQGALESFWLWTVRYASSYATGLSPLMGWFNFKSQLGDIFSSMLPYWAIAFTGLVLIVVRRDPKVLSYILPLLAAAFIAICPGFHFRPHYFILLAPVVALLSGGVVSGSLSSKPLKIFFVCCFFAAAAFQLWNEKWFLFSASRQEYLKKAYQTTKPFVETAVVADYLSRNTTESDLIQVFGSEPQIYFYTNRIAASGHIYMYPLMEEQPYAGQMQHAFLQDMAARNPKYLVLVDDLSSWLSVSASGNIFREKLNELVMRDYTLEGVAAVSRENKSFYVFGPQAGQYVPGSGSRILVYKLKGC